MSFTDAETVEKEVDAFDVSVEPSLLNNFSRILIKL